MSCGWFRYNTSAVFASNSPTLSMSSTAIRRDYSNSCMILVNEGINPTGISIYKHLWLFQEMNLPGNLYLELPIPLQKYHLKFNVNNKNGIFPTTSVRWKNICIAWSCSKSFWSCSVEAWSSGAPVVCSFETAPIVANEAANTFDAFTF